MECLGGEEGLSGYEGDLKRMGAVNERLWAGTSQSTEDGVSFGQPI